MKDLYLQQTFAKKRLAPNNYWSRLLLLMVPLLAVLTPALAGNAGISGTVTTHTLGTGTGGNTLTAIDLRGNTSIYHASANLYRETELTTAGVAAGSKINKIKWTRGTGTGTYTGNLIMRVYLKDTTAAATTVAATTFPSALARTTQVLNTTLSLNNHAPSDPLEVDISAANYTYNGGSLIIIVETQRVATGGTGTSINFNVTTGTSGSVRYWSSSTPLAATPAGTNSTGRANVVLTMESSTVIVQKDIQIRSIVTAAGNVGSTGLVLKVFNPGITAITSASFNVSLNGSNPTTYNWTGTAAANSETNINIGNISLGAGINNVTVTTDQVNGFPDEGSVQNSASQSIFGGTFSGNYTINPSASQSSGNTFKTWAEFGASISQAGVSGHTYATVVSGGNYTDSVTIDSVPGASSSARIYLNGNGRTLVRNTNLTSDRAAINLNRAKYVTVHSFKFSSTATTNSAFLFILPYTKFCRIINNEANFNLAITSATVLGIAVVNTKAGATTTMSGLDSNAIIGNTISGPYTGIIARATSNTGNGARFLIQNNTVVDCYSSGIELAVIHNSNVIGNTVTGSARTDFTTFAGIELTNTVTGTIIRNNRIYNPFAAATTETSTMYGLAVTGGPNSTITVINNLIHDLAANGTVYGIYNTQAVTTPTAYHRFHHNTIHIYHPDGDPSTSSTTAGIYFSSTTATTGAIEVVSNLVYVDRKNSTNTTGRNIGIWYNNATSTPTVTLSNNNAIYVTSTNGNAHAVARRGSNNYTDLAGFRSDNNSDQASVEANPVFTASNFGMKPSALAINDKARTPLLSGVGLNLDFSGGARPKSGATVADPGALEFDPILLPDAVPISVSLDNLQLGNRVITARVLNQGSTNITNLKVAVYVNNVLQTNNPYTATINMGDTGTIVLGTYPVNTANTEIKLITSAPNGGADVNVSNDTLVRSFQFCTVLSGTYTLDPAQADDPLGIKNFTTFTNLAYALNTCGVNGHVTINVANTGTPYVGQLALTEIPGAGSNATVTINGNYQTLEAVLTTTAVTSVVYLNGADWVRLNDLKIRTATGSSRGWGIQLMNDASNNIISNCFVTVDSTATGTSWAAIVLSGSISTATTNGNYGSNNLFTGNTLQGGYYGIAAYGSPNESSNNRFVNNLVKNNYLYGISIEDDYAVVAYNQITRPTRTPSTTYYAINSLGAGQGMQFYGNRIYNLNGGNPTSNSVSGIRMSSVAAATGTPVKIFNNLIYNLSNTGDRRGIIITGSSTNIEVMHNTVVLDGANGGSNLAYGISIEGASSGISIYNNLVSNTRTTTGNRAAIAVTVATATYVSNNNAVYTSDANRAFFYNGAAHSISSWQQNVTGSNDLNSRYADPEFENAATFNFKPQASSINGLGRLRTLTGITHDIDSVSRSTNPDPGAYEFIVNGPDLVLVGLAQPSTGAAVGTQPININLYNSGTQAVNSATLAILINGSPLADYQFNTTLSPGQSMTVNVGTYNFAYGSSTIKVYARTVNGGSDISPTNDTTQSSVFFCSPLTATITVDKNGTPSGSLFTSFASLADAINNCGATGTVTVNVVNGPYAEDRFNLANVPGSGSIVINGNNQLLSFTGIATQRNPVSFNDVANVTINNLQIQNTGTVGSVVFVGNNTRNITINNCQISGSLTTTSTAQLAGVAILGNDASSSAGGSGISDITVSNNVITGMYSSIWLTGGASTPLERITLTGNTTIDFYSYAFRLSLTKNTTVSNNLVTRSARTSVTTTYCFYTSGISEGLRVERNRLTSVFPTANTSSLYLLHTIGDATAANPAIFRNNLAYSIGNNGILYSIYGSGSDYARFENNTFAVTMGGAAENYFFYSGGTSATGVAVNNNLFYLNSTSSSTEKVLYYLSSSTTGGVPNGMPAEANGNIFYATPATGTLYPLSRSGTVTTSLDFVGWQSTYSRDVNSRYGINPNMLSLTDPTQLFPREKAVDNIGVATTATTDYAGTARGANIDAGAYQFTGTTGGVANDDCAAAQALTSGGACSNTSFSTALANRSGSTCSGTSRPADDDVWFSFTPSSSNVAVLVTGGTAAGTLRNPVIELYSGSCGSMSIMACQNAETGAIESVRSNVTPGQTYYVRVYSAGEEQINAGTGTICVLEEAVITTSVTGGTTYHSVTVKNGGNLTLPASASVYYDLTVESGGTLTLTGATTVVSGNRLIVKDGATLNIAHPQGISTAANTGALRFSSITMGRVEANHTATGNSVTGNAWPTNVTNMSIAPGTGNTVTLTAPVNVFGTLTVTNGTLAAGTNALVLKSAAAGTAAVAPLTGGAAITGSNITAERWIPFYGYPTGMYVMVGTPITGKTAAAWANNGNTLTYGTTSSSVWDYDPTNSQYQGWVPQANGSMAAAPGKGLYVFFRNGLQQQTSKITGSLFQGNTTQNLKYCASGCSYGSENGFNLIANPYAAPIDFDRVTRNNTDAAVYIFNHQRQAYVTYVNGISTVPGDALFSNGILASGQGFMVRANAADASVTFSESNKEVGVNPNVYRQQPAGTLRLKLAGADQEDVAVVAFRANATLGHDANFDAAKFPNAGLNLASFGTAAHGMAINSIPAQISSRTELPLSVSAATSGSLTISLEEAANLPEMDVWLLDRQSGMQYPVTAGFSYSFVHNTASNGNNNRLFLVFEPAAATAANAHLNGKALLEVYPNPSTDGAVTVAAQNLKGDKHVLTVTDVVGRVMSTQAISATGSLNVKLAQQLPAGVYQIQLETNGERLNSRLVVK